MEGSSATVRGRAVEESVQTVQERGAEAGRQQATREMREGTICVSTSRHTRVGVSLGDLVLPGRWATNSRHALSHTMSWRADTARVGSRPTGSSLSAQRAAALMSVRRIRRSPFQREERAVLRGSCQNSDTNGADDHQRACRVAASRHHTLSRGRWNGAAGAR